MLPLFREAEERGDHYTLRLHSVTRGLLLLVQDQPGAARQRIERGKALWTSLAGEGGGPSVQLLIGQIADTGDRSLRGPGDGAAAYRRLNPAGARRPRRSRGWRSCARGRSASTPWPRWRSTGRASPNRRLIRAAASDARGLHAMRRPWTSALARVLEAGVAFATGAPGEARARLERAHAELTAAGMPLYAALVRRRLGELDGGAEGARAIAEADAWLSAQGVRAPERLARIYVPEVA